MDCVYALQAKVVDLLHGAAFSNGLRNSLFCEESRVGNFDFEDVRTLLSFYFNVFDFSKMYLNARVFYAVFTILR